MGFFDQPNINEILEETLGNNEFDVISNISYPVGSIVTYNLETNVFLIKSPDIEGFVNMHILSVGVVLEQLNDLSFIVLYKGFLNQEALDFWKMRSANNIFSNFEKNAPSAVIGEFNHYVRQYKKHVEGVPDLYKATPIIPSNRHMDIIYKNKDIILKSLSTLIGEEKIKIFKDKLYNNPIYCNISGHIVEWQYPKNEDDNPEFYSMISRKGGYFLPILHISLVNNNKK